MTAGPSNREAACRVIEMINDGIIGDVHEVHCWTNRPVWPQGMMTPAGEDPVPSHLDWDLWCGPSSLKPYKDKWAKTDYPLQQIKKPWGKAFDLSSVYHPWVHRGWIDYGSGALGDMGCHHFNTLFRALKLRYPTQISATSTKVFPETYPLASIVLFEFPAREGMPQLRLYWYDGGLKPPRPAELEDGRELPDSGNLLVGDKGRLLVQGASGSGRLIPESKMKSYTPPPQKMSRGPGNLWEEWIDAIRDKEKTTNCDFEWSRIITEACLLGNIAIRIGKTLQWDGEKMTFINDQDADSYLKAAYRKGWTLESV
jgi:predicted dehydrogenase